jgi:hypothetical protein
MKASAIIDETPTAVNIIAVGKNQNLTMNYSVTNSRSNTPYYTRLASPRLNHLLKSTKGYETMDALRIINELGYHESYTFFLLRDVLDPLHLGKTGKVAFNTQTLSKSEQTTFSKGYTQLKQKNLLLRVKKGLYMFNPNFLIPVDYELALTEWLSLKEASTKITESKED